MILTTRTSNPQQIKELLPDPPIVLHGASTVVPEWVDMCNQYGATIPGAKGVPDEMLAQASQLGVSKINVDTDLRLAFTANIRRVFAEQPEKFDPREYLGQAREAVKKSQDKILDIDKVLEHKEAENLREAGFEYGAKTGRPRRVGPIDIVATRYGVEVQAATEIALTKLDVLSYMDKIPVCTHYEFDGEQTDEFPFHQI